MPTIIRKTKTGWKAISALGGDTRRERVFPRNDQVQSVHDVHEIIASELWGDANRHKEAPMALVDKTWDGDHWLDDFTLRLKELREQCGLTQARLAELAGLSPQAVAALEQGARGPTWDTACRLAYALGVGVETFRLRFPGDGLSKQASLNDVRLDYYPDGKVISDVTPLRYVFRDKFDDVFERLGIETIGALRQKTNEELTILKVMKMNQYLDTFFYRTSP